MQFPFLVFVLSSPSLWFYHFCVWIISYVTVCFSLLMTFPLVILFLVVAFPPSHSPREIPWVCCEAGLVVLNSLSFWFLCRIWMRACCCCWVASVMSDSVRPHRRQPTRLPLPRDSPGNNTGLGFHFLLQCMKVKGESEVAQLSDPQWPPGLQTTRLLCPWDFPGKSTGVGCHCLLQNSSLPR